MTNPKSKSTGKQSSGKSHTSTTNEKSADASNPTKLDRLADLLNRRDGASIAELTEATGWQPHSVRGAMSGALKRKGLTVTSDVVDGVRRYRIGATS